MGKSKSETPGLAASARKVWLAGLGALAEAEDKGDKFFKSLVKKGKSVEPAFQEPFEAAGEAVRDSLEAARSSANQGVRDLEAAVDRAVRAAMKRAGIASSKDVDALRKEIAKLKRETKKNTAGRKKAAKKKTGAKKKASKSPSASTTSSV